MRFTTRAIHVGQEPDPSSGATIRPISITSTFSQERPGSTKGYDYARTNNPTRQSLETCLASLEEGEACAAFSSGMAAVTTVLQTLGPGDGVVAGHDLYGGTIRVLERHFKPWGLEVGYAADTSLSSFKHAASTLSRPRLVWLETPSNPLLSIVDIAEIADWAHTKDMAVAVDNTFASPFLQKPLLLGADFVVHSSTKYLGGHSDVVGGAVIARQSSQLEKVRFLQNAIGAVPGPWDCYLVLRGLKTLGLRMAQHCKNAERVVSMLDDHSRVERVYYPGLSDHPGHAIALRQMSAMGGMVSFEIAGGPDAAVAFFSRLKVFSTAESLGAVESLASVPALMTHASLTAEARKERGLKESLIRLSVGVEDIEDLLEDLQQALG